MLPLLNAYSRFNERQADRYAFRSIATVAPFISAMNKLADQNLAERSPRDGWSGSSIRIRQFRGAWPRPAASNPKNVGASVLLVRTCNHHRPRGDSRPRLSGGARLRYLLRLENRPVELRSTGQARTPAPTWFVLLLHERGARAYIVDLRISSTRRKSSSVSTPMVSYGVSAT